MDKRKLVSYIFTLIVLFMILESCASTYGGKVTPDQLTVRRRMKLD